MFLLVPWKFIDKDFRNKSFFGTSYGVSTVHLRKLSFQLLNLLKILRHVAKCNLISLLNRKI